MSRWGRVLRGAGDCLVPAVAQAPDRSPAVHPVPPALAGLMPVGALLRMQARRLVRRPLQTPGDVTVTRQ
jgi:hypothetical protein